MVFSAYGIFLPHHRLLVRKSPPVVALPIGLIRRPAIVVLSIHTFRAIAEKRLLPPADPHCNFSEQPPQDVVQHPWAVLSIAYFTSSVKIAKGPVFLKENQYQNYTGMSIG